jgi:hypothetical protein
VIGIWNGAPELTACHAQNKRIYDLQLYRIQFASRHVCLLYGKLCNEPGAHPWNYEDDGTRARISCPYTANIAWLVDDRPYQQGAMSSEIERQSEERVRVSSQPSPLF